jgi:hypothetical protein
MHRNTALLVIFLGTFAAIVVGVNVAQIGPPQKKVALPDQQPTATPTYIPSPTVIPTLLFISDNCGITLTYPQGYSKVELENGATTFLDPTSPIDATTIQCQNVLTKQLGKGFTAENIMIGSVSATLYTPPAPATGSAQEKEKLYFRNPNKKKDVVVSGSGATFQNIISTLIIQ